MGRRVKLNYSEGTCVLVPVEDGGYARGVIARYDGKGRVFGYFFGPKYAAMEQATMIGLYAKDAVLVGKFGDLGLINNEWSILGQLPGWRREDWPMPPLIRVDDDRRHAWLSFYDERTFKFIREEKVDPALVSQYPEDGLMGSEAVGIYLSKLLPSVLQ
jgi:hypothetical protein